MTSRDRSILVARGLRWLEMTGTWGQAMKRFLDCLVTYFGLDENGRPSYRRYFCYHIVAGPGPTAGAGVASITTLAIHDESERCTFCRNFFAVDTGGPAAAIARALRYLDAYHGNDHLRRVQSEFRDFVGGPRSEVPSQASPASVQIFSFQGDSALRE